MRSSWLQGLVFGFVTLSVGAQAQDFGRGRGDRDPNRDRDRDRVSIDVRLQQERIDRGLNATRARQYANADYEFRSIELELVKIDDRTLRQGFEAPLREIREALSARGLSDYEIQRRVERNAFELQRQFDRLPNNGGGWGGGRENDLERGARDLEQAQTDIQTARWGWRLEDALRRAGDVASRVQRDVDQAKARVRFDADLDRASYALDRVFRTLQDRFMTAESKRGTVIDALGDAARAIRNSDACRNGGRGPGNGGPWPRLETVHVRCDSRDNGRLECPTNVDGIDARLTFQRSRTDCVYNQTFGLSNGGRMLWVTNGCRGEFDVTYRR